METFLDLKKVFNKKLSVLDCEDLTKSYIIGIFIKYQNCDDDLSRDSLTLLFQNASAERNFLLFQNIGDWIFFTETLFPEYYSSFQPYIKTLAQLSYDRCYKMIDRQWKVYQHLADDFEELTSKTRHIIREY